MIVVSDTTPLISLMKASQLEVLQQLFGEVLIPTAVFDELTSNDSFKEEAQQIRDCPYIRVVSVSETKAVDVIKRQSSNRTKEAKNRSVSAPVHSTAVHGITTRW